MIIVVDLDDTLLNSEHKISDYDLNVLKRAKTKGHKIVVSTLRSLVRCLDISKYIDADVTSCFLGNFCISNTGEVIKSNPLPFKDFEKVIQSFKSVYDGWIGFESDKMSVIANREVAAKYNGVEFVEQDKVLEILKNSAVFKLSFECKDDEKIISEFKKLAENFGVGFKFSRGFRYIDLFPKNTEKAETLKFIKQMFNEEMIVFGDDLSDKKSIELADTGVAMQNALDEVKQVADIVADSNNNSGVGKVLEKLLNL